MATFLMAFLLVGTIIAAMSIGVILQNKPIKGSCGGIAALGLDTECEICGGDRVKCDEYVEEQGGEPASAKAQFYDASKKL